MKILIICQYFPPDITAAAFRMYDTADLLRRSGHEIRVITAVPHRAIVEGSTEQRSVQDGDWVVRCRVRPLAGSGLVPYLRHYLSFLESSTVAAWRMRALGWVPDVIWASSPPLFAGITGYFSSILFRRPWVLDVRDIWPDSAVAAGQLRPGGFAFRVGKRLERFLYRRANQITCVSAPMHSYIGSLTKSRVTVVYNGVKHTLIANGQRLTPRVTPAPRVLLYAGNLGRVQDLDKLIQAAAGLKAAGRMNAWEIHLLGAGAVRGHLERLVERLEIRDCIKILPPVARETVAREMSAADALFLSLKPDPALRMTIPSKLFDYLATGMPVVAGIVGEGAEIARRSGGNVVYSPESPNALGQSLERLFGSFEELAARAQANPAIVKESLTREHAVEVLEGVLEDTSRSGSSIGC
jgi:glycosyltransferase involved in cell wall biosynthesis